MKKLMNRNDHYGIARRIFEIENDLTLYRHVVSGNEIDIADHVTMSRSSDGMVWYLWYHSSDQKYPFFKAIPTCLGVCYTKAILKAQPWVRL